MSGGAFEYLQSQLAAELFGWDADCTYGKRGHEWSKNARKINPMKNKEVSELVWDALCLIHSLDWFKSGDNCEETYEEDLKWFKDKWLGGRSAADSIEAYKQDIRDFADEIIKEIENN